MSKNDTWMPFYIGDYLADTMHLNTLQHGAYMLLLMHHWRNGPLPNDDAQLAAIARCDQGTWRKTVGPVVRGFFSETDFGLCQKRLMSEREFAARLTQKRAKSGAAGAAKRWQQHHLADSKPIANAMANASQTDGPSPSQLQKKDSDATHLTPADAAVDVPYSGNGQDFDSPLPPASSAAPEPIDLRKQAWLEGRRIVSKLTGMDDKAARSFVGKLAGIMPNDFSGMLAIFHKAEQENPLDPAAWMMAAAQARSPAYPRGKKPEAFGHIAETPESEMVRRYLAGEIDESGREIRAPSGRRDEFHGTTIDGVAA